MNIAEAIKILNYGTGSSEWAESRITVEATKLGIEALNRIQAGRVAGHILWEDKLPGETE